MRPLGNIEVFLVIHTKCSYRLTFSFQGHRIQHYPIADEVNGLLMKDARRYLMQYDLFVFDVERMTGVGSTLEPGDQIVVGSEIVHYFSLSFIPPLEA